MNHVRQGRIAVLVLAAGAGRRFGGRKQLADIEGRPMIRHVVSNMVSERKCDVIVVTGAYGSEVSDVLEDLDVQCVENKNWEEGIGSSIRAGILYLIGHGDRYAGVIIVLGDQYRLTYAHLAVLSTDQSQCAAVRYPDGPGVPAYFPRARWHKLLKLIGDQGAREILLQETPMQLFDIPEAHVDLDTQPGDPEN